MPPISLRGGSKVGLIGIVTVSPPLSPPLPLAMVYCNAGAVAVVVVKLVEAKGAEYGFLAFVAAGLMQASKRLHAPAREGGLRALRGALWRTRCWAANL